MLRRPNTLKQWFILIMLTTTGLALLLADALMFAAEVSSLKKAMVKDVSIKANLIGNQCSAALLFNVQQDAKETLGALYVDEHVEYAAVYTREGKLFAAYSSGRKPPSTPPPKDDYQFTYTYLDLTHPILLYGERIGTVVIRSDLKALTVLLARYTAAAVIVLLVAMLAAYALLVRLQLAITAPVTNLVQLMEQVSRDKDYSRRAGRTGPQELVSLSGSFNEMLAAIQSRDRDLERSLAELQTAYGKLKDLDRVKSDFISTVSHELRTPITSIKAFAEILSMKRNLTEERKKRILTTISDESDRLARLINDLLDLSRIESGVIQWREQDTDMNEVVQTVLSGILPLAQNKGISIQERSGDGLPLILADRDRLMQVVVNVMSNAIKFTPAGGRITVKTFRQDSPAGISVSVADTGTGISAEDLDSIFEKFHRTRSALEHVVEGTGIGLTICRHIVEHYGGRIWATSEHGKGSVFTFFLPQVRSPALHAERPGL